MRASIEPDMSVHALSVMKEEAELKAEILDSPELVARKVTFPPEAEENGRSAGVSPAENGGSAGGSPAAAPGSGTVNGEQSPDPHSRDGSVAA